MERRRRISIYDLDFIDKIPHMRTIAYRIAEKRGVNEAALNCLAPLIPAFENIISLIEDPEYRAEAREKILRRCIRMGTIISVMKLEERTQLWMAEPPISPLKLWSEGEEE